MKRAIVITGDWTGKHPSYALEELNQLLGEGWEIEQWNSSRIECGDGRILIPPVIVVMSKKNYL